MKRIIAFVMCVFMLILLCACNNIADETFTKDGITLTLTTEFIEKTYPNYHVCYESKNIAVFVLREGFDSFEGFGDYTLAQYAELMKLNSTKDGQLPTDVKLTEGVTYYEYSYLSKSDEVSYKYFTAMYKGDDAFWTVQFATEVADYEGLKSEILKYAQTVKVNG